MNWVVNSIFYCPDGNCFDVQINTRKYGDEISWSLGKGKCSSSQEYGDNKVYTEQCCLSPDDYELSCDDSFGDGWHGGFIQMQEKKYCEESFKFNLKKIVTIVGNTGQGIFDSGIFFIRGIIIF